MPHESCIIFWCKCPCCGAVKYSYHIRVKGEWSRDLKNTSRCPENIRLELCDECQRREYAEFIGNLAAVNFVGIV